MGPACLSSLEAELWSLRPGGQAPLSLHPSRLAGEGRSSSASRIALLGKGALSPLPLVLQSLKLQDGHGQEREWTTLLPTSLPAHSRHLPCAPPPLPPCRRSPIEEATFRG